MKNTMRYNITRCLVAVCLVVLAVSCEKDQITGDFHFSSTLEQPTIEEGKSYLSMERYIYWQATDSVRVYSGKTPRVGDERQMRTVVAVPNSEDPRFATIDIHDFNLNRDYYGIFPARCGVDANPAGLINMPTEYKYNNDFTFGTMGMPMVAWGDGTDNSEGILDPPALDFHSVCGIARIQISSSAAKTIREITFTECGSSHSMSTLPISGDNFAIKDINKNAPYLTHVATPTGTTIKITAINQAVGNGKLLTFYLPLPAVKGANNTITYALRMKVTNTASENFTKDFSVKIRRNCLSPLPAINITSWTSSSSSVGMVGCGTELRPFLIYNVEDLQKVRDAFNMGTPKINDITITSNTYFKIVRSDISLTNSNWDEGISNFKGHLSYEAGNATQVGVANASATPIFASISNEGVVEGLTVRGTNTFTGSGNFSPLCNRNNGTLNNCRSNCTLSTSAANVAALCVTNNGTIKNAAVLKNVTSSTGTAAGVCLINGSTGVIEDCNITSSAKITGATAAGICHTNNGIVQNAQVYINRTNLTKPYGGLVYQNNNSGAIKRSEILGVMTSTSEVGGVCCINSGLVDMCRMGLTLLRGAENVGGIVAKQMNNTSAEIRNCFNSSPVTANIDATSGNSGGIVGYVTTGKVYNCFINIEVASLTADWYGEIVGRIITGGDVQNCYNGTSLADFYGKASNRAMGINCFNTTAANNCCVYNLSTGKIVSKTTGSYGTEGGDLHVALNAWVSAHGSDYLHWTQEVAPKFTESSK